MHPRLSGLVGPPLEVELRNRVVPADDLLGGVERVEPMQQISGGGCHDSRVAVTTEGQDRPGYLEAVETTVTESVDHAIALDRRRDRLANA